MMKKYISLIKATLSSDMNIFKIRSRKSDKIAKILLPIVLALIIMGSIGFYSVAMFEQLSPLKLEYIVISIFTFATCLLTIIEGIYKSGNILFNSKDDNLLLALPLKRSTVLFTRLFKFYVFELMYNSIFLLPTIIVYPFYVSVGFSYYITSIIMIILLPIIPIVLSVIIGFFTSYLSSKFKFKNIVQIILSFIFLVGVFYFSSNTDELIMKFAQKAKSINEIITKVYYPAGVFSDLIVDFNIWKLLLFIVINVVLVFVVIVLFSNMYYKVNSDVKSVKVSKSSKRISINNGSITKSIIKKEFNRFVNSPVYVINTIAGLMFFLMIVIAILVKSDGIVTSIIKENSNITKEMIFSYMPLISVGLILFASFMSSITCSIISLEGKSFSILKTLPVNPIKIIMAKVYTAVIIMVPFILIGNIALFVYFKYSIVSIILLIILSILLPLVAETFGIIINLKYPKMNALNDTEVVKQSLSSFIAVLFGMVITAISIGIIIKLVSCNINMYLIMISTIIIYLILFILFYIYLLHRGTKDFNKIEV